MFRDGIEAIDEYIKNREKIYLVLSDIGLPKLTGTESFKKLAAINPKIKVILASGYFEPNLKSEMFKIGVKGFIQKPYNQTDVLRKIRTVLDLKE